jgi:tetratricopeptide (TPR) repeat protein
MNEAALLQKALRCYESRSFQEAIDHCRKILNENPTELKALHLMGLSGQEHQENDLAISCFQDIVRYYPDQALGYFKLANIYQILKQYDLALLNYQMAANLDPKDDHIYNNWGVVLRDQGKPEEAVTCFQKAIQLNPGNANAYHNLGHALNDLGRREGSIPCYQKAIFCNPSNSAHYKSLGNALRETGKLDESLEVLSRALERFPDDPEAYYNLGASLKAKGRLEEAEQCYQKAIVLNPGLPETYYNLGNVFKEMGKLDEACQQFYQSLKLNPKFAETYNNLGMIYKEKGELDYALKMFNTASEVKPGFAEAHWNKGLTILLTGNFLEGWEGYEWRWEKPDYKRYKRKFIAPLWQGEDLFEKRILLHAEQGYGDTLQMIRYASLVADRGARVFVECPQELLTLLAGTPGVGLVLGRGESFPEFDFHCPLMSLPKAFGTTLETIPQTVPYIIANPALIKIWKARVDAKGEGFRVGLVWAGNPEHLNDRNRSCSSETLSLLAQVKDVQFYSLQIGGAGKETTGTTPSFGMIDLTGLIRNFSDTAALIENLDLVISVDTAVAHLSGALGRMIWTMLPFSPDWRWLLGRGDSPWYPTMRLYRQPEPGNWKEVVKKVKDDLQQLAEGRRESFNAWLMV